MFHISPGHSFEDATQLSKHLDSLNENTTEIKLGGNTFGVKACQEIAERAKGCNKIEKVLFADIFTRRLRSEIPLALDYFTNAFVNKEYLTTIDFSDNAFGPDGIRPLVPLIANNPNIQHIHLNNNGLGPGGGNLLAKALKQKKTGLVTLICGRNRLETSAEKIAEALTSHKQTLTTIALPQDGIRPQTMLKLIKQLGHCNKLEHLDLQDNTFSNKGGKALAAIIGEMHSLQKLNIADCMLGHQGSLEFIKALGKSSKVLKSLVHISIQYDEVTEVGVSELAKFLPKIKNLKKLELNGNEFDADCKAMTKIRSAIKELGLDADDVLDEMEDMEDLATSAEEDSSDDEDDEEEEVDEEAEEETAEEKAKEEKEINDLAGAIKKI